MKYAIIENGKVVNTAIADSPMGQDWVQSDVAGIGWTYDGNSFAEPETPQPKRADVIRARLGEIDSITDRPRTRRELQLNKTATKAWLQTLDDEADALREELKTLAPEKNKPSASKSGGGGGPLEPV